MPQDLYKWEDGGGLKHHCPICQTPLSHVKCRTVCLGQHVEWCHRYHTLFRKNWSSRCRVCKTTDEQHERRHREIAEILAAIKKGKAAEEAAAMQLLDSSVTPLSPRTPLTAVALNAVGEGYSSPLETPKTTKKERKAAKKAVKALVRDRVIGIADIEMVAKALHPDDQNQGIHLAELEGLSEDQEVKTNLKFNSSTCNIKSARVDLIVKDRETKEVTSGEIDQILSALDIDSDTIGKESNLVHELIEAVKKDLTHFHAELQVVARNKAGFWRWANKRNYDDLLENGKEWDAKSYWTKANGHVSSAGHESGILVETEEDELLPSRNGSIASSVAESTDTTLTVPSSKATSSKNKSLGPTLKIPNNQEVQAIPDEDPGWTKVGTKVLKPHTAGKLTLSTNGGLHHLQLKPKSNFWALSDLQ